MTVALSGATSQAADRKGAASPAFAEVPDTETEGAVVIEPNGAAPSLPAWPVAARAVPPPLVAPAPAPLPAVEVSAVEVSGTRRLDPSPPLSVTVTFSRDRQAARQQADQVASALRSHGMTVEEVEADRVATDRARVLFAFTEDRAAAAAVDRTLHDACGLEGPLALSPVSMKTRRPGAVEVVLPG